jgi:EpsI family protein
MADNNFLQNKYVWILTAALAAQAVLSYSTSRGEALPNPRPLAGFTQSISDWKMVREGYVDEETQSVLKADDTLTRWYASPKYNVAPNLFVAYFKTQRTGKAPHSPKNCLPGAGWEQQRDDYLDIAVPGLAEPIRVNRYVVAKGEEKRLSLYWYQTPNRVVASEYRAKLFTVQDSIRFNRTDTALVRVIVPVIGTDEAAAQEAAVEFVKAFFLPLRQYLPA